MTARELRELDPWIAEHVMGFEPGRADWRHPQGFHPTTDPALAMEVLKKCAEKISPEGGEYMDIHISVYEGPVWSVERIHSMPFADAPTLELAICLFAKQLFSQ